MFKLSGARASMAVALVALSTTLVGGTSHADGAVRINCRRIAVVGDSLTEGSAAPLRTGLAPYASSLTIDAKRGRRIPGDVQRPYSGVLAVRDIRATTGDADCWIIALGTNDIPWVHYPGQYGTTSTAAATNIISSLMTEINRTRSHRVLWVNVNRRDYPTATRTFNAALARRPDLTVIDFYTRSQLNPAWFANDGIHLTATGYNQRAALIIRPFRRVAAY